MIRVLQNLSVRPFPASRRMIITMIIDMVSATMAVMVESGVNRGPALLLSSGLVVTHQLFDKYIIIIDKIQF